MILHWVDGEKEPYFLMVRNGRGTYGFTGGYDDDSQGFMETASRELKEETAQLIDLPASCFRDLPYVSMFCGLYRVYIVPIHTQALTLEEDFSRNYHQLVSSYAQEHLLESSAMTYVSLSQFKNIDVQKERWTVQDYKGRTIPVFSRAKTLLKKGMRKKIFSEASCTQLYEQKISLQRVLSDFVVYSPK